jgi:hypothetical protein
MHHWSNKQALFKCYYSNYCALRRLYKICDKKTEKKKKKKKKNDDDDDDDDDEKII